MYGQDNIGSACTLDARHTRKDTAGNGCNQGWNNQICGCTGEQHGHVRERVGWVAVPEGKGTLGDLEFEALSITASSAATPVIFSRTYRHAPGVFGSVHYRDSDVAVLRASTAASATGFKVVVHEDRCSDTERVHGDDVVSILVMKHGAAGVASPSPPPPVYGFCASCDNGQRDGEETDTDCGGSTCDKCESGFGCESAADCASGHCDEGTCVSCFNGIQDGGETAADCGGSCAQLCSVGQTCGTDTDCQTGKCEQADANSALVCTALTPLDLCTNGLEDNIEVSLDCGGEICRSVGQLCAVGSPCIVDDDCTTGLCFHYDPYSNAEGGAAAAGGGAGGAGGAAGTTGAGAGCGRG